MGYSLREKQAEVVSFVRGRDTFVSLATKSSKSQAVLERLCQLFKNVIIR